MKIKTKNGRVKYLMIAGKDMVSGEMDEATALRMIEHGNLTNSDNEDYPLCVDGKYLFPVAAEKKPEPKPVEPKPTETKAEVKETAPKAAKKSSKKR